MSAAWLLMLLWASDDWEVAGHSFSSGERRTIWYNLSQYPGKKTALAQQPITLYKGGSLLEKEGSWYVLTLQTGQQKELPRPAATPLPMELPYLTEPALLTTSHLHIWTTTGWQSYLAPVWFEYQRWRPLAGAQYGIMAVPPKVLSRSKTTVWLYQGKSGALVRLDLARQTRAKDMIAKKLLPVISGQDLLWVGMPKRGKIALNSGGKRFEIIDTIAIEQLSRHSMMVNSEQGLWLLTFADGLSDALRGWEKGLIRVWASYVSVEGARLKRKTHALGELPVAVALETTSSGSPKLQVMPNFVVKAVLESEQLAICDGETLRILSPSGARMLFTLNLAPSEIVGIWQLLEGPALYTRDGKVHHTLSRRSP